MDDVTINVRAYPKYRFPWRRGNHVELLVNGETYFPAMLEAIATSKKYILLEMYLVQSGNLTALFVEALKAAAQRGVQVYVLLDDFGSRGFKRHDRLRLARSGVQLAIYNPLSLIKLFNNMARDHRKLLLVDGQMAFVGGTGLTDQFYSAAGGSWWQRLVQDSHRPWRETMLRIVGPVLQDWQVLFEGAWEYTRGEKLALPSMGGQAAHGQMTGRVVLANGMLAQGVKRSLIKRMRNAQSCIWICTAYFIPSRKIRKELRFAARRGVDVRLLLPGPRTDHPAIRQAGRRFYGGLLRSGVRIFEYQASVLHAKGSLCDDWVSIGSSNMDRWNLRWNLEANQAIKDGDFAGSVRQMFETDFGHSVEYLYMRWSRRSWYLRVWEYLWGRVDLWLHSLGKGRHG